MRTAGGLSVRRVEHPQVIRDGSRGILRGLDSIPSVLRQMARVVLKKVKHILTIGTDKYSFKAPDIYGDFGSQMGVTKAPASDNTDYKGVIKSQDFRDGKVIKIKARGNVLGTNGAITESREFTFVVPFEKARTALANLDSKKVAINGKTYDLSSARIPQRRRLG